MEIVGSNNGSMEYEVVMYFWKRVNGRRNHSSQWNRKKVVCGYLELKRARSFHQCMGFQL